jgi:hypothetical protein
MSAKSIRQGFKFLVALPAAIILLHSASAYAVYSPPGRPDGIEQASSTAFSGATFVHLIGVACPGRGDGFFVIPSNGKQQLQLDIVLNALRAGLRLVFLYDPTSCSVSTVGTCTNTSPC